MNTEKSEKKKNRSRPSWKAEREQLYDNLEDISVRVDGKNRCLIFHSSRCGNKKIVNIESLAVGLGCTLAMSYIYIRMGMIYIYMLIICYIGSFYAACM